MTKLIGLVLRALVAGGIALLVGRKKAAGEAKSGNVNSEPQPQAIARAVPVKARQPDAIYQFDRFGREQRVVARVVNPEVNEAERKVHFEEVYNSDSLVLADECEFHRYRMVVRKIGYASKIDKAVPHRGRVLRGVTAELLGYREQ